MRVLVTGWFSQDDGGATAGDLLVRDVVGEWLQARGIEHDVAQSPAFGAGVDWFRVAPERYTHVVFACGPVGPRLEMAMVLERFSACRRIAVNVSLVDAEAWSALDVALERDGRGPGRPDLALAATAVPSAPVVARVEIHPQAEYPAVDPATAHAAFDRLLANREAAVLQLDTRLDPTTPGRRSPGEVTSLLRCADVVLTTRLHGLVLALGLGVPVIAVDPVVGGAKVISQAAVLGWPAACTLDRLDDALLDGWFAWCLTAEARERAVACAAEGRRRLADVRSEFDRALLPPAASPSGRLRRLGR